jgi:hypothetical protein
MKPGTLHILTPINEQPPTTLLEQSVVVVGDLVADLCAFPCSVYEIQAGRTCVNITANLFTPPDYWAIARQWLVEFTGRTGLQDALEIDGYGFWWTLSGQKFVPALSELGNSFAWIDLLAAVYEQARPDAIVIHGQHDAIVYLAGQTCPGVEIQVQPGAARPSRRKAQSSRQVGLLMARVLLGLVYLIYALIRRPDVCLFSGTNLLRETSDGTKQKLRDVYLGDVAQALRARGWRVTLVEKYGSNASWSRLLARGFFFPNDVIFMSSAPLLHKLGLYHRTARQWRKKWAQARPGLDPHLYYRGYNIAPLILPLIAHEFTHHAPDLQVMVRVWRCILRIWRPRLLYINDSYGRSAITAIIAAKSLGIPTVEQQHGVVNRDHIPYLVPKHLELHSAFPLCDNMLVWGAHTRRLLVGAGVYEPHQVVVCGFPRADFLLGKLPPRSETLAQLGFPLDARVVLYTSNKLAQGFLSEILDSIQGVTDSQLYWIIKLHPAEKTRAVWERAIKQRQLQTVKVLEGELDFYALLAACDIHVSFTSTTLIEAAILGKLNLGLDIAYLPDPVGYAEAGAFLPVAPARLGSTACELLRDAAQREGLLHDQKAFADDWCLHDGKSVERIVRFVEATITHQVEGGA